MAETMNEDMHIPIGGLETVSEQKRWQSYEYLYVLYIEVAGDSLSGPLRPTKWPQAAGRFALPETANEDR